MQVAARVQCKAPVVARRVQRAAVRPVAAMSQQQKVAGAALASVALAGAFAAAPAEAHNVINTVASAAEGYPFVPPSWLPSILVPLTGWFIPGFVMASLFVYIEKEKP
ncbi:photosystem I reaction center subunit VIII, chloroplast precursor [Scenedesmus sp. NREL 46B-D3]|nr:photosystem I reaction center subunit VIII, chloroplast precursor [Scenedesmus sp. NREL 46B-D3]